MSRVWILRASGLLALAGICLWCGTTAGTVPVPRWIAVLLVGNWLVAYLLHYDPS